MSTTSVDENTVKPIAKGSEREERALRGLADRCGFTLAKSRVRRTTIENQGGYAIKNAYGNIFWGERYELNFARARAIIEDIIAVKRRRRALHAENSKVS